MTLVLENPELEARLLEEAKKRGLRPEDIALEMLREKSALRVLHHDADFLIGTLSDENQTKIRRFFSRISYCWKQFHCLKAEFSIKITM